MRWFSKRRSSLRCNNRRRNGLRHRRQYAFRSVAGEFFESLEQRIVLSGPGGTTTEVTLSFQDGVSPTATYVGTEDTKIRGDMPDRNLGNSNSLEIDGNPDIATILKWDVSQIPVGNTVTAATIRVDVIKTSLDTFHLFELLQPWSEREATFNEVRAGVAWEVAGAQGAEDRGTDVLGTITAPDLGVVTVELNRAGLAVLQSWVDAPSRNHGILFQNYDNASTDDLDFRSRENSEFRPMLTVTYTADTPDSSDPNDPPVADDQSVMTDEDNSVSILLSGSDPNGDPLSYHVSTNPAHGTLTGTAPDLIYTPAADFHGTDSFAFYVNDATADSTTATVSIIINPVNDRPEANDLTVTTRQDSPISITLDASDVDGDALTYTIDAGPAHGQLEGTAPNLTYTPDPGFTGSDSFSYSVNDGTLQSATAEASIYVLDAQASTGIWIDAAELMALPTSGAAWEALVAAANVSANAPNISDQDDNTDVLTLAKALVGVRLGDESYITQARSNIMSAMGTEEGGRTLALGRNLASYVIAADLVGLNEQDDAIFRSWLRETLTEELDGRTLQSTHEDRPNNWGTMAGASRAAVAIYLGDQDELQRTAQVFKGYVGDRSSYAEFSYGSDLSWQADPENPVGINPKGATKEGHRIDGVLPDDMRRGGSFTWPPGETGYPWEGLQGALVQAEILHRAGYAAYEWQDQALLRAVEFLYGIGWPAEGDDQWQTWLIDARYGTSYATNLEAGHGKIMGWTSWTHQSSVEPPITANSDAYPATEDTTLHVTAPGVLANDSNPTGDPLTAVLVSNPANGTLTLDSDGSFTYTPNVDFDGSDSFTYKAVAGTAQSASTTVQITVDSVNDAPVANGQSLTTHQDVPIEITLTGSDIDGDSMTYEVASGPTNGVLTGTAPDLTYMPSAGYTGQDSFTFRVNDGQLASWPATVFLTVNAVASPHLQFGVVQHAGEFWSTVVLPRSYDSMVVIATPNYDANSAPGVVRLRNAVGNSFQVRVDRAGGGAVNDVPVHYVVVEEGVYDAPGFKMEAVKFASTITDNSKSWTGQSRSYQQAYDLPVVVGQVMTYNDPRWSVFWAAGGRRNEPPSSTELTVGKHIGEDTKSTRAGETVGYLVIETSTNGSGTIDGLPYVAAVGADTIQGIGDSPAYQYSYTAMPNSKAAVVSQAGMDGGEGGWAVLYGTDPITPTGSTLSLAIDEDPTKDTRRRHVTEQVAYLIIDPPASPVPPLSAVVFPVDPAPVVNPAIDAQRSNKASVGHESRDSILDALVRAQRSRDDDRAQPDSVVIAQVHRSDHWPATARPASRAHFSVERFFADFDQSDDLPLALERLFM